MKRIFPYFVAAILAGLALFQLTHLFGTDFTVPLGYEADGVFSLFFIKTMLQEGWIFVNHSVSAPGALYLQDYPLSTESTNVLLLKIMSWIWPDPFVLINYFYILRFSLTAVAAMAVLKRLGVSTLIAGAIGLVYAFIPHNLIRGQGHLFVGTYMIVPLVTLVMLWMMGGELRGEAGRKKRIASFVICALTAGSGIYYAYFACVLLVVAALYAFFTDGTRRWRGLLLHGGLTGWIVAVTVMISMPVFLYHHRFGKNLQVSQRASFEAELFGMKIIQLLLPISNHYFPAFQKATYAYNAVTPVVTENGMATLGLTASAGFLLLIFWVFVRSARGLPMKRFRSALGLPAEEGLFDHLSVLNLAAVLLATLGGFGSLIALLFFPGIRAYNRIAIFIAFFALIAIAWVLERLRLNMSARARKLGTPFLAAFAVAAVLDQTGLRGASHYSVVPEFKKDRDFVQKLATEFPDGAQIFQLPFVPFPEHPPVEKMLDYEHVKMYLHSDEKLRWSYPAMTGREISAWQRRVSNLPMREFLVRIHDRGFTAVYVDRHGYADQGEKIVAELKKWLGEPAAIREDGRKLVFKLDLNLSVHYDTGGEIPVSLTIQDPRRALLIPESLRAEAIRRRVSAWVRTWKPGEPLDIAVGENPDWVDQEYLEKIVVAHNLADQPLPESAFKSELTCDPAEARLAPGQKEMTFQLSVKNASPHWWPKDTLSGQAPYLVWIRSHLYDQDRRLRNPNFESKLKFSESVRPGALVKIPVTVASELFPKGTSFLEYDLVQEGCHWAKDLGGKTCVLKVVKE